MNVMKIMAILAAAAAVPSTDAARSLKAANIAAYRQSGCEHGSCDPCHDLQKIQCNADSQCEYTIGVDRNFEHGDEGSGSGCSSKSAYKRIDRDLKRGRRIGDGEVNKAMAEMGCSQMYSHRDCKRQNEDAVGNSCAWDDCWDKDYPHCVESADVAVCPEAPEPPAPPPTNWLWSSKNENCVDACERNGKSCNADQKSFAGDEAAALAAVYSAQNYVGNDSGYPDVTTLESEWVASEHIVENPHGRTSVQLIKTANQGHSAGDYVLSWWSVDRAVDNMSGVMEDVAFDCDISMRFAMLICPCDADLTPA